MGGKVSRQVAWNWLLSFMVSWAKPGKSRSRTQRAISAMRAGTTDSARNCKARSREAPAAPQVAVPARQGGRQQHCGAEPGRPAGL